VVLTPTPVETLSPITTIVHAETVSSTSVPKPHVHRDSAPTLTAVPSALAAPSATVLTGISRDRK
jgi:hypothetical protein